MIRNDDSIRDSICCPVNNVNVGSIRSAMLELFR